MSMSCLYAPRNSSSVSKCQVASSSPTTSETDMLFAFAVVINSVNFSQAALTTGALKNALYSFFFCINSPLGITLLHHRQHTVRLPRVLRDGVSSTLGVGIG